MIRAPDTAFDLAVPSDVQIMDLLPSIVQFAGTDLDETGLQHSGWVLQRLGEPPLDEESTPDALGLHDGDALYLRPRDDTLPPIHFDDLVDSVAGALQDRPDTWRPEFSRRMLIAAVLLFLGVGLTLLALSGPRELRCAVAAGTGVLLLAAAASASRAMGDAITGTALGAAAMPFMAMAAALVPPPTVGGDLFGARLLAAGAAAAGTGALALAVVGASAPLFIGTGMAAFLIAVEGLVMLVFGARLSQAAALVSVCTFFFGALVPAVAFRLSGLRLPPLPSNADQLQEGIESHDAENVLKRSVIVNQYTTAFYLSSGVVAMAGLTGMLRDPGLPGCLLMAALGALGVLHGSRLGGLWPRLALTIPGLYAWTLLGLLIGVELGPVGRLAEFAAIVVVAGGLALASWTVPGRRMLPHWAHVANLLHSLAAVSLLPLALWVFGVFGFLRGLGG
ncbi:type VII secretion integral membrane protein EccD [Streptomyces sp. NPDC059629]|uniref:type VII secretion integral membrane protein EccD n=1 Tax=Streptomyces sp. NPDC059629 TaxID=3346889 RepID=UPI00369B21B0